MDLIIPEKKKEIMIYRKLPKLFLFFFVFAALAVLSGCSGKKTKTAPPAEKVPVTAVTATAKDVPIKLTAIGNVQAYSVVSVTSRATGQLLDVYFSEGQSVAKGQKLFLIDPEPKKIIVSRMEAELARNNAQLLNARVEERRYAELVKKGFVAQADYDNIHTQLAMLEAMVRGATQDVENARLQLSYCTIYAPISGRTGNLLVHQGNLIRENDGANPLVVINQIQPVLVAFSIPEQRLAEVREFRKDRALKVEAVLSGNQPRSLFGSLTFINNAVSANTGTIELKAVFNNGESLLWPGQFVSVVLSLTTRKNAVVVPTTAVQMASDGQFIFVVKPDSSVEKRLVEATAVSEVETVVEKGISPGETVVTDGQLRLVPGAKVEIKNIK
ncbi:MAG: efflux RND transporter periplasmic adaptor subunit [Candidatus Omnitrophica bacterium]|nr:efflux RND transporter periplasmic adaptor subunit [Candidatus Omnitrophota bacterium]